MTNTLADNSVYNALCYILKDNIGLAVFDYSCADDFDRLWSLAPLDANHVLIVWAQTARDNELRPVNAEDCLSPVDWAVSYVAQNKDDPAAWPEVLILDLNSEMHSRISSIAHLNTLKSDQLPWLSVETDIQLVRLIDWLMNTGLRDSGRCLDAIWQFVRVIRLNFGDIKSDGAYDRHAISNIIGPMILRGKASMQTLHSSALLHLLQVCGLAARPEESSERIDGVNSLSRDVSDLSHGILPNSGSGLHVLLLDDQAGHGWTDWVQECLPDANVHALSEPSALIQEVQRQLEASGTCDLRFRFSLPGLKDGDLPVLLLDLRLFSGKADEELCFYRDVLLPLIARFMDRDDLAWPAFSSSNTKFTAARDAIIAGTLVLESPEHHEALTWLPRVLSLVDMSLPIVLFSSTGRRSIERAFSDHRNIILGFEKPRLFDSLAQSIQMVLNTAAGLARALEDAGIILLGRMRARQSLQCLNSLVDRRVSERYGHFELFIDESGTGRDLVVGGLVAGFASLKDANEFDDRLVQAGVRYFPTLAGPLPPGEPLLKKMPCRQQFEDVVEAWKGEGRPLLLSLVTLDGIEPFTTPLRFLDMDFMDNRWRLAVEAVVEVFLSEIVARLKLDNEGGGNVSVSIFGPTRVSLASSKAEAFMNQARFGTTVQKLVERDEPVSWGNHAVAESNMLHTACELLRSHCLTIELEKAKFVRLQYTPKHCREWEVRGCSIACVLGASNKGGDPAGDYKAQLSSMHRNLADWRAGVRSLHYVCDQALRDIVWRNRPWAKVADAIPTFHEIYDKFLRGNLAASRSLDARRTMEAMVSWRPHATPQPKWRKGVRKVSEAIGARLAVALGDMSGAAFMESSFRLRSVMRLSKDVSVPSCTRLAIQGQHDDLPVNTKAQEVVPVSRATRYLVRLDNLPNAVTPAGLLDLARRTSCNPVGCEVADDLDEGRCVAAIYFDSAEALEQIIPLLRSHGWRATPFIAPERQEVSELDPESPAASAERTTTPLRKQPVVMCRLRVGPIPKSIAVDRVVDKLKDAYPETKLSVHCMMPDRGGGKYVVEFNMSNVVPTSGPSFIVSGHRQLPVEFVRTQSSADSE